MCYIQSFFSFEANLVLFACSFKPAPIADLQRKCTFYQCLSIFNRRNNNNIHLFTARQNQQKIHLTKENYMHQYKKSVINLKFNLIEVFINVCFI